jgi:hypothetical protein
MDINHLKSLVAAAKSSEHLYEEQAAAMEFTLAYGEQLLAVVEAAQLLAGDGFVDDGMYIVEWRFRNRVKQALAALEGEI